MRSPLLWLALALHVALASAYAWTTPHFEGPDENSHYEYAWHLANAGALPLTADLQVERGLPQTEAAVLAHHPPLYYALLGGTLTALGEDDAVFAPRLNPAFGAPEAPSRHLKFVHEAQPDRLLNLLRWLSALLGCASIACVHALGRACCPQSPRVADLAALLVACLPMWSGLHGLLNSDVLAATLSTATLVALARALQRDRVRTRDGAILGVLLGLAWLTKLTTLFLGGLAGLAAATLLARRRASASALAVAPAVALALSGWWFVRNYLLHGDWLAMSAHDASFQPLPPELRWPYLLGLDPSVPAFLPELLASLFGRFGWFSVQPHPALVWCGAVVTGLAVTGLALAWRDRDRAHFPRAAWLLVAACAAVLLAAAWFNFRVYQPQSRLLFPAVGPAAVLLAAGLVRLSTSWPWRRWLLPLLPAAAAAALFGTFLPRTNPELAPAPDDHRSLVGGVVTPDGPEQIAWRTAADPTPQQTPPTLAWTDPDAPAGTRYTLYAFDDDGRVWLATHEWTAGALSITGDSFAVPELVWSFLPKNVPLSLRLRRVPSTAEARPRELACSPPLAVTRR